MARPGTSCSLTLPICRPLARRLALSLAGIRAVLGVSALVAPTLVGRPWIGEDASQSGTRLFGRALGGRDLALGLGALLAARHEVPIRGWVEAGALSDACDTGATLLAFGHLPHRTRLLVLATCLGAALAGAALAPLLDDPLGDGPKQTPR